MHVSKKHATERGDYTVITQCPPIQGISTCLLAERAQLSSHPACVLSASLLQGRRRSRGLYRDKPQISCSPGARCRDMRKLKQTCSAPSAKWDELSFSLFRGPVALSDCTRGSECERQAKGKVTVPVRRYLSCDIHEC